jgi:hypothetical protein
MSLGSFWISSPKSNYCDCITFGVVSDTKYDSLRKNNEPTAYLPLRAGKAFIELRTITDANLIVTMIRDLVGGCA